MYNINEPTGKSEWEKCRTLLEYSRFVRLSREEHSANPEGFMERAVRRAIRLGILSEYLRRNAREVENMFFGEYDYEMDIAVQREEAAMLKAMENAKNLLKMNILTSEQISQAVSIPLEEILALKEELAKESLLAH